MDQLQGITISNIFYFLKNVIHAIAPNNLALPFIHIKVSRLKAIGAFVWTPTAGNQPLCCKVCEGGIFFIIQLPVWAGILSCRVWLRKPSRFWPKRGCVVEFLAWIISPSIASSHIQTGDRAIIFFGIQLIHQSE